MVRQSMTGFATLDGTHERLSWQWELRSVNGKGFDLRLRLPDGLESLEKTLRSQAAQLFGRGSLALSLKTKIGQGNALPRVNPEALEAVLLAVKETNKAAEKLDIDTYPTSAADLLALRGVIEYVTEDQISKEAATKIADQIPAIFQDLLAARQAEGTVLAAILQALIDDIEKLTKAAFQSAEARRTRAGQVLRDKVKALLETSEIADEARLQQELALLAIKSDVTEEIDRLTAHVGAARLLLKEDKPIGRRLDFLMQEFNREANTLCSKSGSTELTAIGLDLKTVIDQMREQVQNLE